MPLQQRMSKRLRQNTTFARQSVPTRLKKQQVNTAGQKTRGAKIVSRWSQLSVLLLNWMSADTWPDAALCTHIVGNRRYVQRSRVTRGCDMLQGICPLAADWGTFLGFVLSPHHVSLSWPRLWRLWKWASLRMRLICRYDAWLVRRSSSEEVPKLRGLQGPTAHRLPAACSVLLMLLVLSLLDDCWQQ